MAQAAPFTIDRFLGVNRKETETLLLPGEAADMVNWEITDDLKLNKMFGYERLFPSLGAHKINGMWAGELHGVRHFIFACAGHVYEHDLETGDNADLGEIADAYPTTFFAMNNTVYILDGTELYSWSGAGSISVVSGYIPTVFTAAAPAGGGTILEGLNYISGTKTQKFSADGEARDFQLAEYDIESVDAVTVNGALMIENADYTVNLEAGMVNFVTAPPEGTNNVIITWTKVTPGDRQLITNCRYYGGEYYSRRWLYGNPNRKNTRYVSGVTMAGVSDPTYWPKYTDSDVGEFEITGICTQYDKQIIFTGGNESEASAWYSYEESYTDPNTGILTTVFPVKPISSKVGNVAKGQIQIIYNNPFTLWKGVYEWSSTYVVNEKNVGWISERIQNDLDEVDLRQAITVDWSDRGQYWLCVGKKVWVLNYRVSWYDAAGNKVRGAWYVLELKHAPTCFTIVDSALCFGTGEGTIMRFDEDLLTYDGQTIAARWDMGSFDLGVDYLLKSVREMLITIKPQTQTKVKCFVSTDINGDWAEVQPDVTYAPLDFENLDFDNIDFVTNYNPQPFTRRLRLRRIGNFKLRLLADNDTPATVLSVTFPVKTAGKVRRR